jgi:hypothetical protein
MNDELKAKIEALVAEIKAATDAGETSGMEALAVALAAHRAAGGTFAITKPGEGMLAGMAGAMMGAALFSGHGLGVFLPAADDAEPKP